jgi:uncharacterized membrane protein YhhN
MPKRALIEQRPWLLASLMAGISFFFFKDSHLPGLYQMAWKGAGVALLAVWAFVRHPSRDARQIGVVMALGALGDVLIEVSLEAGAVAFLAGHAVAMWLYLRNWRPNITFSQRLLASLVVPVSVFVAVVSSPPAQQTVTAIYAFFVSGMAASAWTSRFPRYRTGIGAMMFLASDLLIFARMGPLATSPLPDLLIWPLYYFGQFLICVGVVGTITNRSTPQS